MARTRRSRSLTLALVVLLGAAATHGAGDDRWAVAVFPSGTEFGLEIAATVEEKRLGYMFRETIGSTEGMLFLYDEPGHHSFWMKNCKVALDLIFLDGSFRVVAISADQLPCPARGDCPSILPARASQFVLEVAAGTAAREQLAIGDQLVVLSDPPISGR